MAMALKLLLGTEKRCRRVYATRLATLIKTGVDFPSGEADMLRSEPAPEDLLLTHR